jgi:hypothetical protein
MTVASLIVAILALMVAIASAIYTRREVSATEGALAIERGRRLEERRPRLSGKVERVVTRSRGAVFRLKVTLESDEPLTAMELTIPAGQNVAFKCDTPGVDMPGPDGICSAFSYQTMGKDPKYQSAGIRPREPMIWEVELRRGHVKLLRVEATCHGLNGERWGSVLITAPVKPRD